MLAHVLTMLLYLTNTAGACNEFRNTRGGMKSLAESQFLLGRPCGSGLLMTKFWPAVVSVGHSQRRDSRDTSTSVTSGKNERMYISFWVMLTSVPAQRFMIACSSWGN